MRIKLLLLLILAISLLLPAFAAAELVIIVNKDNNNPVDEQFAAKVFVGSVSRWPSRGGITVVSLPDDHPVTRQLNAKLLHKSAAEVNDIWSKNYFTGKTSMPKAAATEIDVKRLVSGNKYAIGYIDSAAVDNSVKVVLTVR